ncbi:MAG: EamA family transporter RarD [Lachnospiraceae bacterium]|nr:EamA family transporter RarD [Lachnospiraceae bacterium]
MDLKSSGAFSVFIAYVFWGLLTLFWNLLGDVNSVYILFQRVIWSAVFMGILLLLSGKAEKIKAVFKDGKMLIRCFVCGILITVNWGVYIYAVTSGHVLDASLGYFIEPIVVGMMGMILFKEKLSKAEKITFVFAMAGLLYMLLSTGTFPVLSIVIALSFAVYGAFKKSLALEAGVSLFMETLCIVPIALLFTLFAESKGIGAIGVLHGWSFLLLPACGIVTSIPLLLFNIGVKKIPYYLSGIIMYVSPTLQFLTGILFFKEALDTNRLIAFAVIWIGIAFTMYEQIKLIIKDTKKEA